MIGDMNKYTQFQVAQSIAIAAANEGGGAAGVGVGFRRWAGYGADDDERYASAGASYRGRRGHGACTGGTWRPDGTWGSGCSGGGNQVLHQLRARDSEGCEVLFGLRQYARVGCEVPGTVYSDTHSPKSWAAIRDWCQSILSPANIET